LLPKIGTDIVYFIRERTRKRTCKQGRKSNASAPSSISSVRVPEFLRILNEAEFFAPIGYQKHLDNIATAYVRILRRARQAGAIVDYNDEEFEAIVHMLMGARGYLSRRYSYVGGSVTAAPEHVISAYRKLVTRGLYTPEKGNNHDR
jgi:hypothetical protein